jgi:hypothetical protein
MWATASGEQYLPACSATSAFSASISLAIDRFQPSAGGFAWLLMICFEEVSPVDDGVAFFEPETVTSVEVDCLGTAARFGLEDDVL